MDDRRIDGGTNSTLRTKEQGTHLTLNEHDDDDDDDDDIVLREMKTNVKPVIPVLCTPSIYYFFRMQEITLKVAMNSQGRRMRKVGR